MLVRKTFKLINILVTFTVAIGLYGCGKAYFPIEFKISTRSERQQSQENVIVELVALTTKNVKQANADPYKRRVIEATDLNKPAKVISVDKALVENLPDNNDPGPYLIGIGDVLAYGQILTNQSGLSSLIKRELVVKDDGLINLFEVGSIKAQDLTLSQLEDLIYQKLVSSGADKNFELAITGFKSKRVMFFGDSISPTSIPYIAQPMYLEEALATLNIKTKIGVDYRILIRREKKDYVLSLEKLLTARDEKLRLFPNDKIFISPLNYKRESVLVVGETGAQRSIPINSFQRPTLSDAIFNGSVLNNVTSDFSQIYVIRKRKSKFRAYHLDITNPTRIVLASNFEMRPDDIVFVATQPLSLYSRTLSQILGSTGLTITARDQIRSELN